MGVPRTHAPLRLCLHAIIRRQALGSLLPKSPPPTRPYCASRPAVLMYAPMPPCAGMLSGLFYQADLFQYVFDYCRNTLAGQIVTQALPVSLLAPLPLNLDGGNGVNSTFPSLLSYYADTDGFIAANPDPINASVVAWCCATANCNMGTAPKPMPPMPPPQAQGKGAASFAVPLMAAPAVLSLAVAVNVAITMLLR